MELMEKWDLKEFGDPSDLEEKMAAWVIKACLDFQGKLVKREIGVSMEILDLLE